MKKNVYLEKINENLLTFFRHFDKFQTNLNELGQLANGGTSHISEIQRIFGVDDEEDDEGETKEEDEDESTLSGEKLCELNEMLNVSMREIRQSWFDELRGEKISICLLFALLQEFVGETTFAARQIDGTNAETDSTFSRHDEERRRTKRSVVSPGNQSAERAVSVASTVFLRAVRRERAERSNFRLAQLFRNSKVVSRPFQFQIGENFGENAGISRRSSGVDLRSAANSPSNSAETRLTKIFFQM